jgi:hypothetical protein
MTAGHRTSHVWRDSPLMSSSLALVKPLSLRLYVYLLGHLPHAASEFSLAARHIIYDIVCARDSTLAFCIFAYAVGFIRCRVSLVSGCFMLQFAPAPFDVPPDWFFNPIYETNAPTCDVGSNFWMKGLQVLCNCSHQIKVYSWR